MNVLEGSPATGDVDAFLAALEAAGERGGCAVQAFDARLVVDRAHLRSAVEHATRAVERGEAIARDRAVEILLYAAGRRQIDRALEMGVESVEDPVVVVVDADPDAEDPAADEATAAAAVRAVLEARATIEYTDEAAVQAFFDVSAAEREATDAALGELVRERVALLDVEK